MDPKKGLSAVIVVLLFSIACVAGTPTVSGADPVGSAVAATLAGGNAPTAGQTQAVPGATTESVAATAEATTAADTPLPACLPAHPGPQALHLPAALAAGANQTVTIKNLNAETLSTRSTLGFTFMESDQAHLAGNLALGAANIPIVYFMLADGGRLRTNTNDLLIDKWPTPNLIAIAGAEGRSAFAYVTLDMINQSTNRLYVAGVDDLAAPAPRLTWSPAPGGHTGNAIQPLAIRYGLAPEGIWFTYTMYGIGDLLYPPFKGLTYFNLATNQTVEFLSADNVLGGISPDQTMIAYRARPGGSLGPLENGFTIRNLLTCAETHIPFDATSNLGGGWMEFSPDNRFVAWTEAGGPDNMTATFRMRVARTDGTGLFDAPVTNMTSLLGGEAPNGLRPVGWMANHLLVLEAYLEVTHGFVQVVWAPDPAQPLDPVLGANQSVPLADGRFIGFVYP
jgi:hypothetical protein